MSPVAMPSASPRRSPSRSTHGAAAASAAAMASAGRSTAAQPAPTQPPPPPATGSPTDQLQSPTPGTPSTAGGRPAALSSVVCGGLDPRGFSNLDFLFGPEENEVDDPDFNPLEEEDDDDSDGSDEDDSDDAMASSVGDGSQTYSQPQSQNSRTRSTKASGGSRRVAGASGTDHARHPSSTGADTADMIARRTRAKHAISATVEELMNELTVPAIDWERMPNDEPDHQPQTGVPTDAATFEHSYFTSPSAALASPPTIGHLPARPSSESPPSAIDLPDTALDAEQLAQEAAADESARYFARFKALLSSDDVDEIDDDDDAPFEPADLEPEEALVEEYRYDRVARVSKKELRDLRNDAGKAVPPVEDGVMRTRRKQQEITSTDAAMAAAAAATAAPPAHTPRTARKASTFHRRQQLQQQQLQALDPSMAGLASSYSSLPTGAATRFPPPIAFSSPSDGLPTRPLAQPSQFAAMDHHSFSTPLAATVVPARSFFGFPPVQPLLDYAGGVPALAPMPLPPPPKPLIAVAHFTPEQRDLLHSQLSSHVQLLVQVRYLTLNSVLQPLKRLKPKRKARHEDQQQHQEGEQGEQGADERKEGDRAQPATPSQPRVVSSYQQQEPLWTLKEIWEKTTELLEALVKKRTDSMREWQSIEAAESARGSSADNPFENPMSSVDSRPLLAHLPLLTGWLELQNTKEAESAMTHDELVRLQTPYIPLHMRTHFADLTPIARLKHSRADAQQIMEPPDVDPSVAPVRPWNRSAHWCYTPLLWSFLTYGSHRAHVRSSLLPSIARVSRKNFWQPSEDALLMAGWKMYGRGQRPGKASMLADWGRLRTRFLPGRQREEIVRRYQTLIFGRSAPTERAGRVDQQETMSTGEGESTGTAVHPLHSAFYDEDAGGRSDSSLEHEDEMALPHWMRADETEPTAAAAAAAAPASIAASIAEAGVLAGAHPARAQKRSHAALHSAAAARVASHARIPQRDPAKPKAPGILQRELSSSDLLKLVEGMRYFPETHPRRWAKIVELFLPEWDRLALRRAYLRYEKVGAPIGVAGEPPSDPNSVTLRLKATKKSVAKVGEPRKRTKTAHHEDTAPTATRHQLREAHSSLRSPAMLSPAAAGLPSSSLSIGTSMSGSRAEDNDVDMTSSMDQQYQARATHDDAGRRAAAAMPAPYPPAAVSLPSSGRRTLLQLAHSTLPPLLPATASAPPVRASSLLPPSTFRAHAPPAAPTPPSAPPASLGALPSAPPVGFESMNDFDETDSEPSVHPPHVPPLAAHPPVVDAGLAGSASLPSWSSAAGSSLPSQSIRALADASTLVQTIAAPLLAPVHQQMTMNAEQYAYASAESPIRARTNTH